MRKSVEVDEHLADIIAGCTAAHRRLEATLEGLDDHVVRRPSRLPGWTVGHVLTHLARNAESHVRMLNAAADGRAVEQYAGGREQRQRDIELGAGRSAAEMAVDVRGTSAALEAAWAEMTPEAWAGHGLTEGDLWPCRVMPFHRWREVEVHHADLGLAYSPTDWPREYVDREFPLALATLTDRLPVQLRPSMLAWLLGRAEQPMVTELGPWQGDRKYYDAAPAVFLSNPGPGATPGD